MRLYSVLRDLMKQRGVTAGYLSQRLDKGSSYISHRLTGEQTFDLDDVYAICDILHIDHKHIPYVFPRGGMYAGEIPENKPSPVEALGQAVADFLTAAADTTKQKRRTA